MCVYIGVHICVYVHIHTYIQWYDVNRSRTSSTIYSFQFAPVIYEYTYIFMYIYTHIHIYIHTSMYVYVYGMYMVVRQAEPALHQHSVPLHSHHLQL